MARIVNHATGQEVTRAEILRTGLSIPVEVVDETLTGTPYSILQETAAPTPGDAKTVIEGPHQLVNGKWQQAWLTSTLTVEEAQDVLREQALALYWQKVVRDPPTYQEALNTTPPGDATAIIDARQATWQPRLASFIVDVNATDDLGELFRLYRMLQEAT